MRHHGPSGEGGYHGIDLPVAGGAVTAVTALTDALGPVSTNKNKTGVE